MVGRNLGMEGWVGCIAVEELHNLVVVGIAEEVVHRIHLGLELENRMVVAGSLVVADRREVVEEGGIDLVGHTEAVVEARTVLEEVQEEHHIGPVAVEGIDLEEEERHIEAVDSLAAGRKEVVEEERRI